MRSANTSQSTRLCSQISTSCFLAIAVCIWPLAASSQAATTIVDTDGFETGFSLGVLQGQAGWVTSGQGGGSAVVQNGLVESGTKAVRVDRGANSDDRWAMPVGGLGFPSNRYILIDWDMYVLGTGASSSVFGPFFGVDTYDDTVSPSVLGALGVDATTGDVLYQAEGTGVLVESGATVNFGSWNNFQIKLDFELDEYQVLLNGSVLASTGFVDGPRDSFTDADIAAFAASFDTGSQSQTGIAYFDNFLVRDVDRADFDVDGDVDADDLTLWEAAFGVTNGADADLDGDSDGADLLIWQREFNGGVGASIASIAAVPEPSTLALVLLTLIGLGLKRAGL